MGEMKTEYVEVSLDTIINSFLETSTKKESIKHYEYFLHSQKQIILLKLYIEDEKE